MPIDVDAKAHAEYVCSKEEFDRILQRFPESSYFHPSLVVPYHTGTRITYQGSVGQDRKDMVY